MADDQRSASDAAKAEAARQAVILAAGLLTLIMAIPLQRKLMSTLRDDPAETRMREALKRASRWDRTAGILFNCALYPAAGWAWSRARKARADYEAERP